MRYCECPRSQGGSTLSYFPGVSKLMNLLWVSELQRRLDEEGVPITLMTVHPGTVSTGTRPLYIENAITKTTR